MPGCWIDLGDKPDVRRQNVALDGYSRMIHPTHILILFERKSHCERAERSAPEVPGFSREIAAVAPLPRDDLGRLNSDFFLICEIRDKFFVKALVYENKGLVHRIHTFSHISANSVSVTNG